VEDNKFGRIMTFNFDWSLWLDSKALNYNVCKSQTIYTSCFNLEEAVEMTKMFGPPTTMSLSSNINDQNVICYLEFLQCHWFDSPPICHTHVEHDREWNDKIHCFMEVWKESM